MKHSEYKNHLARIKEYGLLNTFEMELVYIGGYWRFVCHKQKIATGGYDNRDLLETHCSGFIKTPEYMKGHRERYNLYFPDNGVNENG